MNTYPITNHQTNIVMCCPNCNKVLLDKPKLLVCQSQYSHEIWKTIYQKTLTIKQVEALIKKEKTNIIKALKAK